jgi:hypothetical protein
MSSLLEICDKSAYLTLHRHFLLATYMKSLINRSMNTVAHFLEMFIAALRHPSN